MIMTTITTEIWGPAAVSFSSHFWELFYLRTCHFGAVDAARRFVIV